MARPKKTLEEYSIEYSGPLFELTVGTPMRHIAEDYGIGLSTVLRLKKRFF